MPNTSQFLISAVLIFLVFFWTGILLLTYHLLHFGTGSHPKRIAFIMIIGSVLLTVLSIMLALNIH
jgi:hypothetical protein